MREPQQYLTLGGTMYRLKTVGGYDYLEVLSGLQKAIRRGHEEHAMYWGLELSATFSKALWLRLRIIANEDVAAANILAVVVIESLHRQYEGFAGRDGSR